MKGQSSQSPAKKAQTAGGALPSAFNLFTPSIEALKVNMGALIGLLLAPLLAMIPFLALVFTAVFMIAGTGNTNGHAGGLTALLLGVAYFAFIVFSVMVGAGLIVASLHSARGEKISFGKAFQEGLHYFWRFIGLSLCIGLAVVVGLVLLIVPGVFMFKRYFLAPYYLFDKNMGVVEAMRQSAADSKKYGGVWGVLGVVGLIDLVGLIPFVGWIGTLVLDAMYLCAPAIRYLQIQKLVDQDR